MAAGGTFYMVIFVPTLMLENLFLRSWWWKEEISEKAGLPSHSVMAFFYTFYVCRSTFSFLVAGRTFWDAETLFTPNGWPFCTFYVRRSTSNPLVPEGSFWVVLRSWNMKFRLRLPALAPAPGQTKYGTYRRYRYIIS